MLNYALHTTFQRKIPKYGYHKSRKMKGRVVPITSKEVSENISSTFKKIAHVNEKF